MRATQEAPCLRSVLLSCLPHLVQLRARPVRYADTHRLSRSLARMRRPAGLAGSSGSVLGRRVGNTTALSVPPSPALAAARASPEPSPICRAAGSIAAGDAALGGDLAASR